MERFKEKFELLGGKLKNPAKLDEIVELELRLGIKVPSRLQALLLVGNGSEDETDEGMWSFWSTQDIQSYSQFCGKEFVRVEKPELAGEKGCTVELLGSRLILFADSMIHLPVYGVFHSPGSSCDGMVFMPFEGYFSALNLDEWLEVFIDRAEDGLLFPES